MRLHRLCEFLLVAACSGVLCGGTPSWAAAGEASASLGDHWWVVTKQSKASDFAVPGTGWRFRSGEMQFVQGPIVERRLAKIEHGEPGRWRLTFPHMPGADLCFQKGTLQISIPGLTLFLRPATAEESRRFERKLASHPGIAAACERFRGCWEAACPILGGTGPRCDPASQTDGTSLLECERGLGACFRNPEIAFMTAM